MASIGHSFAHFHSPCHSHPGSCPPNLTVDASPPGPPGALGWRPGASFLGESQAQGAQAPAAANMSQHPSPQVGEAAVLGQHNAGPRVALGHVQSCDGHCTTHLRGSPGLRLGCVTGLAEGLGSALSLGLPHLSHVSSHMGFEQFPKLLPLWGPQPLHWGPCLCCLALEGSPAGGGAWLLLGAAALSTPDGVLSPGHQCPRDGVFLKPGGSQQWGQRQTLMQTCF